jgi:hypothetical protein
MVLDFHRITSPRAVLCFTAKDVRETGEPKAEHYPDAVLLKLLVD